MKTLLFYFSCLLLVCHSSMSLAQSFTCDSVEATSITMDAVSSTQLSIGIMNNMYKHINYPYVKYVLNANGDTVAKGTLNNFAHLGNDYYNYVVTANSAFSTDEPFYTIGFVYYDMNAFDNVECKLTLTSPFRNYTFCDSLAITNMNIDSTGNLSVSVLNNSSKFINYPYVDFILDSNGDTIARGNMNFFGQLANSSQDYSIQVNSAFTLANATYTVFFKYQDYFAYQCPFSYVNTSVSLAKTDAPTNQLVIIYPNPVNAAIVTVDLGNVVAKKVILYTLVGQKVREQYVMNQSKFTIDLSSLHRGGYLIELTDSNGKIERRKLLIE